MQSSDLTRMRFADQHADGRDEEAANHNGKGQDQLSFLHSRQKGVAIYGQGELSLLHGRLLVA